jgi:lipopolysaccharide export system permease protein
MLRSGSMPNSVVCPNRIQWPWDQRRDPGTLPGGELLISLPAMRLLDRYLLRELLIPLGYCLSGFLVFWISFDLLSELSSFQEHQTGVRAIAAYYVARLPAFLVLIFPIALLLAALYALTHHSRHQELVAIRAAGISFWRLSLPYLAVGSVLSLAIVVLNEYWVPEGETKADQILERPRAGSVGSSAPKLRVNFSNDREGRIWNVQQYNPVTSEMLRPDIEWRRPDGSREKIIAERGVRTNGVWTFWGVQCFDSPPARTESDGTPGLDDLPAPSEHPQLERPEFSETPEQINSEIRINTLNNYRESKKAHLSLRELWDYRQWHPQMRAGRRAVIETLLQTHLAVPWTCLVVVLIAMPFGMASNRRNLFVGVAGSIVICFSYFILNELCQALGAGGYLPPWLAVWTPNCLFASIGILLTQRLP